MEVVAQMIMDTRQAKGEIDNKLFNLSVVIEISIFSQFLSNSNHSLFNFQPISSQLGTKQLRKRERVLRSDFALHHPLSWIDPIHNCASHFSGCNPPPLPSSRPPPSIKLLAILMPKILAIYIYVLANIFAFKSHRCNVPNAIMLQTETVGQLQFM